MQLQVVKEIAPPIINYPKSLREVIREDFKSNYITIHINAGCVSLNFINSTELPVRPITVPVAFWLLMSRSATTGKCNTPGPIMSIVLAVLDFFTLLQENKVTLARANNNTFFIR